MTRTSPAFAAVDLGATSGRVIAGWLADGRLHTAETGRFPNGPVPVTAGGRTVLHWDVLALWSGVREGLRRSAAHGPVATVGIDSWAVDFGLLDSDGALLGNPVHYRDGRTAGAPDRFFTRMAADEHYARTGVQVQPFNTVFQLGASAGSDQLDAAHRLLLIPDLLGHWLTGAAVTEVTNASTMGLLDPACRQWSEPVLDAGSAFAGRDLRKLLAPLVEPGAMVAPLLPQVAADLGLRDTRWVSVGSHDTASAVVAVPMSDPMTSVYISSGTWSLVGLELPAPVLTEASRAANATNELGVDGTVRYLRNVAGLWLLSECQRTWRARGQRHQLDDLLAAAADCPPLRTVVDVDDPAFVAPGDMPARIAEAARRSGQRAPQDEAQTTRCILDSLALAYRRAVRTLAVLALRDVRVVHVVGGGARNALLCRLTADATGLPVVAGPAEGTAIGNLLVQASAAGALDGGLPAIREVVAASSTLHRWEPAGPDHAWDQAEARLQNTSAARP